MPPRPKPNQQATGQDGADWVYRGTTPVLINTTDPNMRRYVEAGMSLYDASARANCEAFYASLVAYLRNKVAGPPPQYVESIVRGLRPPVPKDDESKLICLCCCLKVLAT